MNRGYYLRRFINIIRVFSEFTFSRFKWLGTSSSSRSEVEFHAHLLIIKKPIYAKIARTCIESFLHYHPNSKIYIHHDQKTSRSLILHLFLVRLFRRNRLHFVRLNRENSWQFEKLSLIKSLDNTSDIYLDADLRFNGQLKLTSSITFFVEEESFLFRLRDSRNSDGVSTLSTNRNTSIFAWGKHFPSHELQPRLDDLYFDLERFIPECERRSQYLGHLREQIALSLFVDLMQVEVNYVKKRDAQFDRSLVESSYFGATGSLFSPFGHKSIAHRIINYFFGTRRNS